MWRKHLVELLEPQILAHPRKPFGYHDVPFGILCYPPEDELDVRAAVHDLAIRLEKEGKRCRKVSAGQLMFDVLLQEAPIEQWAKHERDLGQRDVLFETVPSLLQQGNALASRLLEAVGDMDPKTGVVFVMHTGAFFPFYRTSSLLSQLEGKLRVPLVLLYPGRREGEFGLRFMGKADAEHAYRAAIFGGG